MPKRDTRSRAACRVGNTVLPPPGLFTVEQARRMIYRDASNTVNFEGTLEKRRVTEGGAVLSRGGEMGSETTTTRFRVGCLRFQKYREMQSWLTDVIRLGCLGHALVVCTCSMA